MNIIKNIPGAVKIYANLKHLNKFKSNIKAARKSGDRENERKNILLATSTWGTLLSKSAGMNINVYGRENLPINGPVLYISNHQGYADIVALCSVLDTVQFGFIAKNDLAKVPLYGKWIDMIRSVMINRENPRDAFKAITKGINLIKDGYSMLIFPEGTRSKGGEIGEFKPGATKLATKPKVPIVPITLDGTWKIFEEKGYLTPGDVNILIHPPISTKDLTPDEEKDLSEKVRDIIKQGLITLKSK